MNRRSHFNRKRFNRATGGVVVVRQAIHYASYLNAFVRSGSSLYMSIQADAQMGARSRIAAKSYSAITGNAGLDASTRFTAALQEHTCMDTTLEAYALLGSVWHPLTEIAASLQARALLGSRFYGAVFAEGSLSSVSNLGGVLHSTFMPASTLLSQAVSLNLVMEELTIDVVLQPGDVLVVDTYDYTVTLNNNNAIHHHSGDWLYVDRELYDVQVIPIFDGVISSEDVNIMYDTRYL